MRFGDVPLNTNVPFVEIPWLVNPNANQAPNTSVSYYMADFTIPWQGHIIFQLTCLFLMQPANIHDQVNIDLGASSPPPNWLNPTTVRLAKNNVGNIWTSLPIMAAWSNIAANTTIRMYTRVYSGNAPMTFTVSTMMGSIRAWRTA
jgi:hypothetical protein